MSSDERGTWLAAAWAEVANIPGAAFVDACATARRIVEHPAKLIPTIIRESEMYGGVLKRRAEREEAQWSNRNAPRLTAERTPEPWEADKEEVAALMGELVSSLSTVPPRDP